MRSKESKKRNEWVNVLTRKANEDLLVRKFELCRVSFREWVIQRSSLSGARHSNWRVLPRSLLGLAFRRSILFVVFLLPFLFFLFSSWRQYFVEIRDNVFLNCYSIRAKFFKWSMLARASISSFAFYIYESFIILVEIMDIIYLRALKVILLIM